MSIIIAFAANIDACSILKYQMVGLLFGPHPFCLVGKQWEGRVRDDHCNHHYHQWNFFRSYAENVVFDVRKKEDQGARIGGKGLGDSGNARKLTFFFD